MKGVWVDGALQTLKDFPIPEPNEDRSLLKSLQQHKIPRIGKVIMVFLYFGTEVMGSS
jgi:hypothetical protein